MEYRIEEDLLGKREVPETAYYGIHTLRAMENFQISGQKIGDLPEFVRAMVQVKKACALANEALHVLPHDIAQAIIAACDEILVKGRCQDQFPIDQFQGGAGTSVNMNTNEVIANLALELLGFAKGRYDIINPNDHVNKSQSTNDSYPTGLHLAFYAGIAKLKQKIACLADAFAEKGVEFAQLIKMGRTQLQDAVPMTLGQEFNGFATILRDEIARLESVERDLLQVNLGATAIGTKINTPADYGQTVAEKLAEVTGLEITAAPDLIAASADTGVYVSLHGVLKGFAGKLSKICNDLRLLSAGPRAGLHEINLPQMQAGSSIMPAKVNPVIPEVVNQICFKVIGNDVTVTLAAEAGQLQLNVMEPVILQVVSESLSLLERACDTLRQRCVVGITANPEVLRGYVFNSIGVVTYLNGIIGHHNGDLVGREAARTGKSVKEVVVELGLLTAAEVDAALTEDVFLQPQYLGKIYADDEQGIA